MKEYKKPTLIIKQITDTETILSSDPLIFDQDCDPDSPALVGERDEDFDIW